MQTVCRHPSLARASRVPFSAPRFYTARRPIVCAVQEPGTAMKSEGAAMKSEGTAMKSEGAAMKSEAEETTEKYGLEAGLIKVMTSKDEATEGGLSRTEQAKQLLKQYGSAYLVTSISFAIVSFAACYAAVSAGVDVAGLLSRMGLAVSDTSEKVGTFAIAYAAHKALSPVRFPPTVALTPVVARWFGQKKEGGDASSNGNGKAE